MKTPEMIELTGEQIDHLLVRVQNNLPPGDYELIKSIIDSLLYLKIALENKKTSIKRLLRMIFGPSSEKKKKVIGKENDKQPDSDGTQPVAKDQVPADDKQPDSESEKGAPSDQQPQDNPCRDDDSAPKPKGHGRNGADAFSAAEREFVVNSDFQQGGPCIFCPGKVYRKNPGIVIRLFGQAPVEAKIWELEKYRCNLCGAVFTAQIPEQAQGPKYDETAIAIIALSRYGFGLPFNRLENLQSCLQTPLPASTQWDKAEAGADRIHPAFEQLMRTAAQGDVLYNDDTPMKILELMKINDDPENEKERKGMQTTGILSVTGDRKMASFFTGRKHSGENFADLMSKRSSDKDPPIQMCDALASNTSEYSDVVLSNCNSHARRKFVYEAENYPRQCDYVLEVYGKLYENDAFTKKLDMSDQQRLEYHQQHSGPFMESFHIWLNEQFDQKLVEPNSSMGQAISYVLGHWPELTRFLHVPGVPLDNNPCEQILKKAIIHRKNSLFYKTLHGAYIGDMYMSLIHTCILNDVNPFNYLVELQRHSSEVFTNPDRWLPWNYQSTICELSI